MTTSAHPARPESYADTAQAIVDAIPQTIAVLGPDGMPLYGNRSLLEYTGLTIAEVASATFRSRVFHPEDVARLEHERRAALSRRVPF
jgi:PAS domain S-box-containing protein